MITAGQGQQLTLTWWRCDVVSGGLRNTAPYGVLTVINL